MSAKQPNANGWATGVRIPGGPQINNLKNDKIMFNRKAKKSREWAKRCVEMQNALNENNWKRYGWYVGSGNEMCFDWMVYVNKGAGLILRFDQI